jgi:hypothetical protein
LSFFITKINFVNCDRCWTQNPKERPEAKEIYQILQEITTKELEKYCIDGNNSMLSPRETSSDNDSKKATATIELKPNPE